MSIYYGVGDLSITEAVLFTGRYKGLIFKLPRLYTIYIQSLNVSLLMELLDKYGDSLDIILDIVIETIAAKRSL